MFHKILCATDGSQAAAHAAMTAIELARETGGEVTFLNVGIVPGAPVPRPPYWDAMEMKPEETAGKAGLSEAAKVALEQKFDRFHCEFARATHVADAIVAFADDRHFDHIVVGTDVRSGFERVATGSVAGNVFGQARCPVTIVH